MGATSRQARMDHDGFWKEALDRYLDPFLRICFPRVHAGIDWSRVHVPLDQELRQFLGDTQTRKRQVDRLYRVTAHDGTEEHLFLHVEVQTHHQVPRLTTRAAGPHRPGHGEGGR
jgi:hypothetical protein